MKVCLKRCFDATFLDIGFVADDENYLTIDSVSIVQLLFNLITHLAFTSYIIHCVQKKTPTYVFDYKSGVSWSISIIFVSMEREMNTLQFTYLKS